MSEFTVAVSSEFFSAFADLPRTKQGRVIEFISKFRSNPLAQGINLEKIGGAPERKFYSARVDDNYRAIIECSGNAYLMLWVDKHDDAYDWARRRRCALNTHTGSIQVYDAVAVPAVPAIQPATGAMFEALTDAQLLALGVPEEQLPLVRGVRDDAGFDAVAGKLPRDACEALDLVRDGCDVDEVIELLYSDSEPAQEDDIAAALKNPITRMQFTVVEGEQELLAMMNAPLEKWRVFLHPSQRRLATREFSGPARVTGGAGTGKTVVAMHRAHYLAQKCRGQERILFTTFSANLAQDILANLRKICTTDELRRIDVIHLDAWVVRFLREQDYDYRVAYGDEISGLWEEAVHSVGAELEYPANFFEDEWRAVVQAQGITSLAEYAGASRAGRGVRLDRKKRIQVWKVFEEYRTLMNVHRVRDSATAMNECRQILQRQPELHPYTSIIVDEGQDFGMAAFRLLRTLAGEEHANDLFIVGDAHQRIYRNRVVLSKCGINVKGRSSQLRMNYRTTEEIRNAAMRVLKGIPFDDLDGGQDDERGYRSLTHGDAPDVDVYAGFEEEAAALVKHIREQIDSGTEQADICVVARTNSLLDKYAAALRDAGIRTYEIRRSKYDDRFLEGVRLATMHRVKGLEFSCVFLVGINRGTVPLASMVDNRDPVSREDALLSERCLIYVALTRAKKCVCISAFGKASDFISQLQKSRDT